MVSVAAYGLRGHGHGECGHGECSALGGVDVVAGQLVLVDRDLEQVRLPSSQVGKSAGK